MRIAHLAIVSGAAMLFAASAFAADTQTAATDTSGKDRLICKALVHEGMAIPTRVQCHDQRFWDNVHCQQQEAIMQMQLNADLQGR